MTARAIKPLSHESIREAREQLRACGTVLGPDWSSELGLVLLHRIRELLASRVEILK